MVFVAFILSLSIFAQVAYAHPGRTDSNGGHTNSSTGEYHYHHGYDAHSHYDVDGDGVVDCPYDFDDQTDHSTNSVSSEDNGTWSKKETEPEPEIITVVETKTVKVPYTPTWVYGIIAFLLLVLLVVYLHFRRQVKSTEKKVLQKEKEIHQQQEDIRAKERKLQEVLKEVYADFFEVTDEFCLLQISGAPPGEHVLDDYTPARLDSQENPLAYEYTFYVSVECYFGRRRYHKPGCIVDSPTVPVNACYISRDPHGYMPCKTCHPVLPDAQWVTRYLHLKQLFVDYSGLSIPELTKYARSKRKRPHVPKLVSKPEPPPNPVQLPEPTKNPAYDACSFMWNEVDFFLNNTSPKPGYAGATYIWTALFYTVVKLVRRQAVIDYIFEQFPASATEFIRNQQYESNTITAMQKEYRRFAAVLNKSGIDPFTSRGIEDLWLLVTNWAYADKVAPKNAVNLFLASVHRTNSFMLSHSDVYRESKLFPDIDVRYSLDDRAAMPASDK